MHRHSITRSHVCCRISSVGRRSFIRPEKRTISRLWLLRGNTESKRVTTAMWRPRFSMSELADALARADLVISRAGAGTVAELAAVGKASILVPLPTAANDEQRMNAYEVARVGGALVLEESNLGEHMLSGKVVDLLRDSTLRGKMAEEIGVFYNPTAAEMIATGIISLTEYA